MSKPARAAEVGETTTYVCSCGRVHHVEGVLHWERYILKCGAKVWALQPKRNGPLILKALPASDKPWTVVSGSCLADAKKTYDALLDWDKENEPKKWGDSKTKMTALAYWTERIMDQEGEACTVGQARLKSPACNYWRGK